MDGDQEVWRPVVGFEGRYIVSNFGRVRSVDGYGRKPARLLKIKKSYRGYMCIDLYDGRGGHKKLVHRLVAEAFIENPDKCPQVNHKDCNKENNHADNLEWCTASQNIRHAADNGLREYTHDAIKKALVAAQPKLREYRKRVRKTVIAESIKTGETAEYESINAAARGTDASPSNVLRVLTGEYKQTNGYRYRYKEETDGNKSYDQSRT